MLPPVKHDTVVHFIRYYINFLSVDNGRQLIPVMLRPYITRRIMRCIDENRFRFCADRILYFFPVDVEIIKTLQRHAYRYATINFDCGQVAIKSGFEINNFIALFNNSGKRSINTVGSAGRYSNRIGRTKTGIIPAV